MAEVTVSVTDSNTSTKVPVDGVAVTTAAANPTTGQATAGG